MSLRGGETEVCPMSDSFPQATDRSEGVCKNHDMSYFSPLALALACRRDRLPFE